VVDQQADALLKLGCAFEPTWRNQAEMKRLNFFRIKPKAAGQKKK
jgi:hypothetical protein